MSRLVLVEAPARRKSRELGAAEPDDARKVEGVETEDVSGEEPRLFKLGLEVWVLEEERATGESTGGGGRRNSGRSRILCSIGQTG